MRTQIITEAEYHQHRNDSNGICTRCGEWQFGDCEPDARDYPCSFCGFNEVVGIEEAIENDWIEVTDE